jgi:mono/diheme cytochrome c family protein
MRRAVTLAVLVFAASTAQADSYEEHDYILNCSGCHRMDGAGSNVVPSLLDMKALANNPGAREYWIRVPGAAQAPLTNERLAALMNWLLKKFTGEAPQPPYTAREVGALRARPLRDPIAARREVAEKR